MILVFLFLCILLMIGCATAAMYLSSSSSSTARRVEMYLSIVVAVLALLGTMFYFVKLHQAVLLTPNTTLWYSLLILSTVAALVTSVLSQWKVSKVTQTVLMILAGVGAVILSVSMVMLWVKVTAFKEQLAASNTYPPFFSSQS